MRKTLFVIALVMLLSVGLFATLNLHLDPVNDASAAVYQLYNAPLNSVFPSIEAVEINVVWYTSTFSTGDGQGYYVVPSKFDGWYISTPHAHLFTATATGIPNLQIRNTTLAQDVLSTAITVDATELDSLTAVTQPVVNKTYNRVSAGDVIAFDIDGVGDGACCGLNIRFILTPNQIP